MATWLERHRRFRAFALPATVLLALFTTGCGAGKGDDPGATVSRAVPSRSATAPGGYLKLDGDEDNDDQAHPAKAESDSRPLLLAYGGRANPTDTRAIVSLVRGYFAASLTGDAVRACSLLYPSLAAGLASAQSQPVEGASACTHAMSHLLAQQHGRLSAKDLPTMVFTGVYVKGDLGLATLGFRTAPQSQMILQREGHTWKIDSLIDAYMP